MAALVGRKIGMTGYFNEQGVYIPCTLIEAGPCTVTQVKTVETDGYDALQLGFGTRSEKNLTQAVRGHLAVTGTAPVRVLKEFRTFGSGSHKAGDIINVADVFTEGDSVRISATSKGRGFQGVVRRHHFSGVGMRT